PKSFSSWSGKSERTWFRLFTFESGSQIFLSSSTVRHVAQSFCLLTMTVSASFATWNSTCSMPLAMHACSSSSLIGREALETSVSPAQKRSKPPPVPETPTVTWTPLFSCWNSSAARVTSGPTVLEPSVWMRPERDASPPAVEPPELSSSPPQALASNASARIRSALSFVVVFIAAECSGGARASGVRTGEEVVTGRLTEGREYGADQQPAPPRALRLH